MKLVDFCDTCYMSRKILNECDSKRLNGPKSTFLRDRK